MAYRSFSPYPYSNMYVIKNLALVWLVLASLAVQAQRTRPPRPGTPTVTRPSSAAGSNLRVVITNQIQVQMLVPSVTVGYNKRTDARRGVTLTTPNQFAVTSNRPYGIAVAASSDFLLNRTNRLPVNAISLNIQRASNTGTNRTITLSSRLQNIATRAPATINQPFSVTYQVNPLSVLQTLPTGVYSTTLTYTATQE